MEPLDQITVDLDQQTVITDPGQMGRYLADLQGAAANLPVAVLRPNTTAGVVKAVKWCRENGLAIVPQGGLTGLASGAVPFGQERTVVLALERLKTIREIDQVNGSITVDSGVILADVKSAAETVGSYFPLSHGAEGSSQIGGNLSTNSGGNNALRYGTARDQVLGLEVVLPDGTVWNGLRNLRKNTAGYDLKHLFIGAEGTLGIITAAILKLRPYPHNRTTGFVAVQSPRGALQLLRDLETQVGETVAAFELLSKTAVSLGCSMPGVRYPLETSADWCVLIEVETPAQGFAIKDTLENTLAGAIEAGHVPDAAIAQSSQQRNAFWHLRESIAAAFIEDKFSLKSDTAVPVSKSANYIENTIKAIELFLPDARPAPFGHLGDGNIHFNVVAPLGMSGPEFAGHWDGLKQIIATEALRLGGTISAEHGIGRLKRNQLAKSAQQIELDLMKRIKAAVDPDRRMNPGVLF